jgi:hypothetical protein
MEFRYDAASNVWHCCATCEKWPNDSFNIIRLENLPANFTLCPRCNALKEMAERKEIDSDKTTIIPFSARRRASVIWPGFCKLSGYGVSLGGMFLLIWSLLRHSILLSGPLVLLVGFVLILIGNVIW